MHDDCESDFGVQMNVLCLISLQLVSLVISERRAPGFILLFSIGIHQSFSRSVAVLQPVGQTWRPFLRLFDPNFCSFSDS